MAIFSAPEVLGVGNPWGIMIASLGLRVRALYTSPTAGQPGIPDWEDLNNL